MGHFDGVAMSMLRLSFGRPITYSQLDGVVGGDLLDGRDERPAPFFA